MNGKFQSCLLEKREIGGPYVEAGVGIWRRAVEVLCTDGDSVWRRVAQGA